jgi:hypothetical protein
MVQYVSILRAEKCLVQKIQKRRTRRQKSLTGTVRKTEIRINAIIILVSKRKGGRDASNNSNIKVSQDNDE